jgi:4'-phosphopantetheinyl transferase
MDAHVEAGQPGADWRLTDQRIDLWPVQLAGDAAALHACEVLLSSHERTRAAAFHFEHLRHRYTFAHGVLRLLLGRYANQNVEDLRLSTGARGKPRLDSIRDVEFNLSHSDDIALLGFTTGCEIGVDVERVRGVGDMEDLADRFFCPAESEELKGLAVEQRAEAFFRCWTRKEAYLKAIGDGLHTPLDSFRVTLRPGEPARMLQINGSLEAADLWSLYTVDTIPDCTAAVAHLGETRLLRTMQVLTPADLQTALGNTGPPYSAAS